MLMKRSKLLTIPRAATRMLPAPTHLRRLFVALVALLTMTAQTAWADDVSITADGSTVSEATTWTDCTVYNKVEENVNWKAHEVSDTLCRGRTCSRGTSPWPPSSFY